MSDFNLGIFSGYIYFSLVQQMKILRLKIRVDAFILLSIVNLFKCDFFVCSRQKRKDCKQPEALEIIAGMCCCLCVCFYCLIALRGGHFT